MKIHDITVALANDLPAYPGDPPVLIEPLTTISRGDPANTSRITISSHSGTHIDPPRHYDDCGTSSDKVDLSMLIGPVLVIEIAGQRLISRKELAHFPIKGEKRLIIKTGNSRLWQLPAFSGSYAHLTLDGAGFLAESGIELLGIDYMSVESADGDGTVHRLLLDYGVVILEGLDLEMVQCGKYQLVCLPMKIRDGDGAPVRAILIEDG